MNNARESKVFDAITPRDLVFCSMPVAAVLVSILSLL